LNRSLPISLLEARDLTCSSHQNGDVRGVTLAFDRNGFVAITGDSESGHNLLLRLIGLMEKSQIGDVLLDGNSTAMLDEGRRADFRSLHFGYVFAAPFLLSSLTVVENIAMPLFKIAQVTPSEARGRTEAILDFAGLAGTAQQCANTLPRYEQQCAALARALILEPSFVLVENLDAERGSPDSRRFEVLLRQACAQFRLSVIATVTPDFTAESTDRVIAMGNGVVLSDSRQAEEAES
jgi:ABC-type lipoprotein export system ATPase subunit